jgi:hypothetical protein
MKIKKIVIFAVLITSVYTQSYVDIVTLKNGDIIKGKIIENVINDHIRIELQGGSILTYQYVQIESLEVEKQSTQTLGSGNQPVNPIVNTTPVKDCYNDGYASGQSVSTSGPLIGGFASGFLGGLIGWGIAYVVVAGGNPQPPHYETASLESPCGNDYRQGYKEGALKVKKSTVNIGGALGTLAILTIALSADSSY